MARNIHKSENLRHNILPSYITIAIVFVLDLIIPLGYTVSTLYLMSMVLIPFKALKRSGIYILGSVIMVLIWARYFIGTAGSAHITIPIIHRSIVSIILWVIAYIQIQRAKTQNRLFQSEKELKQNQLRFERAEAIAHVGSWRLDASKDMMEISDEMANILGLPPGKKKISISKYYDFVHPDDKAWVTEAIKRLHSEGKPVDIDYRLIRPDGSIRYIHGVSSAAEEENNGSNIRYGAAKDITERKTVEIELARERELFEGIFSSIPVMITIFDPHLQSFRFNEALHKLTGWTLEDAAEGNFIEKVYPDPEERREVSEFMQSLKPGWREFILTAKDGRRIESSWSNIKLSDNTMIGIGIDISQTKQTERQLEHSNRELQQFAYVASHDLQEPLRMISSYMSLLEKRYKDRLDDKAKLYINFAVDGSKRMTNLIKDLLVFSRVTSQAKEFESVELNKVYEEVMRDLQVLIKEENAKVTSTKLPSLKADPIQMHQLMQNLIGNAIKFHGDKAPEVSIKAKEIENGWLFSVSDNGIGIDSQYYERIFQVFQRLHEREKYPGTGIGLAVCKKIVERHGGSIWVESKEGRGTTFYFTIPSTHDLASPEERDNMEMLSH